MATVRLVDGELDVVERWVRRGASRTVLTEQDAGLLAYLLARPGRAVPREELATEVLGHRARETSRAVDHAIRRLRVKVEVDPAHPHHIESVRGVGYRFRPLRDREAPLVGRSGDLEALMAHVGAPLLTLLGPGGVGKTSLARALVAEAGGRVLELAGARSVDDVLTEVAGALGVSPQAEGLEGRLGEALAALPDRVVVLDDVDHVAHLLGDLVAGWAAGLSPGRTLALTSRVRLGHRQERVVTVSPLGADGAWELFQRRLPPDRELGREEAAPLLAKLDGLPLAIELAASWMDLVSPRQLADRVSTLAARGADPSGRHGSLRAVLDGSWGLLTAPERAALGRAAVFAGPFDLGPDRQHHLAGIADGAHAEALEHLRPRPEHLDPGEILRARPVEARRHPGLAGGAPVGLPARRDGEPQPGQPGLPLEPAGQQVGQDEGAAGGDQRLRRGGGRGEPGRQPETGRGGRAEDLFLRAHDPDICNAEASEDNISATGVAPRRRAPARRAMKGTEHI